MTNLSNVLIKMVLLRTLMRMNVCACIIVWQRLTSVLCIFKEKCIFSFLSFPKQNGFYDHTLSVTSYGGCILIPLGPANNSWASLFNIIIVGCNTFWFAAVSFGYGEFWMFLLPSAWHAWIMIKDCFHPC